MPILNRLSHGHHLDDAALADAWTNDAVTGGQPPHAHLGACAECRARMDAFGDWMEALRQEARAEADEAFPAERLAAQQAHIFRRIEAVERPTRVIAFPTFSRPISTGASPVRRSVAAAAAGLVVGVGLGLLMDIRHNIPGGVPSSVELRRAEPASHIQPISATVNDRDAAFMADVDASLSRNSLTALKALDAITPRAPMFEGRQR